MSSHLDTMYATEFFEIKARATGDDIDLETKYASGATKKIVWCVDGMFHTVVYADSGSVTELGQILTEELWDGVHTVTYSYRDRVYTAISEPQ